MQEKKVSVNEFFNLLSKLDKSVAREHVIEFSEISKYSNILFFESRNKDSYFSRLSPELINKIASYTGTKSVIDEEIAERVAYHGFNFD